jgi:hypothetical protein
MRRLEIQNSYQTLSRLEWSAIDSDRTRNDHRQCSASAKRMMVLAQTLTAQRCPSLISFQAVVRPMPAHLAKSVTDIAPRGVSSGLDMYGSVLGRKLSAFGGCGFTTDGGEHMRTILCTSDLVFRVAKISRYSRLVRRRMLPMLQQAVCAYRTDHRAGKRLPPCC